MHPNLLATKLYIPPVRKNLVPRPRLVRLLDEAHQQDKKLILVSASAGYGKTTLVADWLGSVEIKTAWLSLDPSENDPARFLAYLIAALQQIDKNIGGKTLGMLQSPQPLPPEIVLTALINEIAAVAPPFMLVFDDYHVIESMPVHQQLTFLVEHQPPQMHLVIVTREDPPLPLARLRARGQLTEIRQEELRFSLAECADFLQRGMGLNLSAEDITALERRTEGWIVGLQLAALSLQGYADQDEHAASGFIQAFSGSSHYVLEYLIEEVLDRQLPEEQDFLLKTSILDRLSGSLCDAVTGRSGSSSLLERLEHANLFIIPLDQSRTWYRYHHLFADLLRQRLHSSTAVAKNELHRRASQWLAAQGHLPEAIQHALAAAEWDAAAALISSNTENMLRGGELATLLSWLKALPEESICKLPQLCRDFGWALSLTGQLDAADPYLQRAEAGVQDDDALLGTILVAQAYNLRMRGEDIRAIERAQRALSLLPFTDHLSRGLVALTLGLIYWNRGDFPQAEQAFLEVDRAAQQSQNHYARMTALTYQAMIQAIYGRLHRAAELCREVIQLGGASPTVAPAWIELGAILYEWNDQEQADHHLKLGVELSQHSGNVVFLCEGLQALAILQQTRGEASAALSSLQRIDQFISERQVTPFTRQRHAACHARLALAQNDLRTAVHWADRVTEPADASLLYPRLGLTQVRLLLAQGEKAQAAEKLSKLSALSLQAGWGSGLIEVRSLQALAAAEPPEALQFLEDALKKAQAEGFIRTFVDKGPLMKALLERLKPQSGEL